MKEVRIEKILYQWSNPAAMWVLTRNRRVRELLLLACAVLSVRQRLIGGRKRVQSRHPL